jgi:hypothetical protein
VARSEDASVAPGEVEGRPPRFRVHFLCDIQKPRYNWFGDDRPKLTEQTRQNDGGRRIQRVNRVAVIAAQKAKKKNGLGGRDKSLQRLASDKEIQAFCFDFLWLGLAGFCRIWLDLDPTRIGDNHVQL